MVNRAVIVNALRAIERVTQERTEVWRVVISADHTIIRRIYRGSFAAASGSRIGESQPRQEDRS